MEELVEKYQPAYIERCFSSMAGLHEFSVTFYQDVGDLYDALTRLKNADRNPTGFSIDDAPILGLLARISKLVKEVVKYYERDNAEIIGVLERPMIEASIIATYLMLNGLDAITDYRKCSYKDRLRILRDLEKRIAVLRYESGETSFSRRTRKNAFRGPDERRLRRAKKERVEATGQKFPDDIRRDRT